MNPLLMMTIHLSGR